MFRDQVELPGQLEQRISHGSSSGEFLRKNFGSRECYDTVYVSANPWIGEVAESFHAVRDLVHDDATYDFEHRTVLPETVVDETEAVAERYPDKRLIVHFMQPHFPFLGETADALEINSGFRGNREFDDEFTHIWARLKTREDEEGEQVREAYRENLDLVIPHVERLLDSLTGKSVVTSDHGNLVGDRTSPIPVRGYGHPTGRHVPQLVEVPWLVRNGTSRRTTAADPPETWDEPEREKVNERLSDLGYR
jgi:arylsulfatase A-like enzyme